MTVAELIRELEAMPNQHARVDLLITRVWVWDDSTQGHRPIDLEAIDAQEADDVRHEGSFVLIRSK